MTRFWKAVFSAIVLVGVYAALIRFGRGLGAATHLSDDFPWGLWVGFDVLVGVGLAAGGFVIAATVTIFQIKKYSEISRPAILTAFLGYLLVIFALMFDLGRPYRIWHPLVMGNPHSVMFEVAMCVMFYTTVLAIEFSPVVFKKLGLRAPLKVIHVVYVPLVVAGVLLSTLHQSSLGTLYIIVPDKLHPLWYTPLLPVFFFLSAIAGGLAMTIFESFLSRRAFGRRLEQDLLQGVARVIVVTLAIFLVLRFQNLMERGSLGLAFGITPESVMFWGEILLGVMVPMVLFAIPRVRRSQAGLFLGSSLTVIGFILNRLNVAITGMVGSSGVNYIPSWMEFAVTIAIVAVGFALFRLAVQHFEVFPAPEPAVYSATAGIAKPVFPGRALAAMWVFLVIGFAIFGFSRSHKVAVKNPVASATDIVAARSPAWGTDLQLIDDIELPMGEDSPGPVVFNHSSHVDYVAPDCRGCHAGQFRITDFGRNVALAHDVFDQGKYCGSCHDGDGAFGSDDDCESCHGED